MKTENRYADNQGPFRVNSERTIKWDRRFLDLARLVATWSKDPSTQVGAVIVAPDNTVVSLGFNGFPKKMLDAPECLSNREEKYSRIIHGEVNALVFAGKPVHDCTLYTVPFMPCDRCVVQMIQAGIIRFVFPQASAEHAQRWQTAFDRTKDYVHSCGLSWCEYVD